MRRPRYEFTIAQCEYQLARAQRAHDRAAKTGDDAAYERTSDAVGRWEVNLRVAKGQSETFALTAIFGPSKR